MGHKEELGSNQSQTLGGLLLSSHEKMVTGVGLGSGNQIVCFPVCIPVLAFQVSPRPCLIISSSTPLGAGSKVNRVPEF